MRKSRPYTEALNIRSSTRGIPCGAIIFIRYSRNIVYYTDFQVRKSTVTSKKRRRKRSFPRDRPRVSARLISSVEIRATHRRPIRGLNEKKLSCSGHVTRLFRARATSPLPDATIFQQISLAPRETGFLVVDICKLECIRNIKSREYERDSESLLPQVFR